MTNAELKFFEGVPNRLHALVGEIGTLTAAMRPRFVRVSGNAWVNPTEISSICEYPEDMPDNENGGRVNVTMKNEMTFETTYKTADEIFKALGLN